MAEDKSEKPGIGGQKIIRGNFLSKLLQQSALKESSPEDPVLKLLLGTPIADLKKQDGSPLIDKATMATLGKAYLIRPDSDLWDVASQLETFPSAFNAHKKGTAEALLTMLKNEVPELKAKMEEPRPEFGFGALLPEEDNAKAGHVGRQQQRKDETKKRAGGRE